MMAANVSLVLVRSIYSQNVGACARAAANMGAQNLILIDPQCEIDSHARQGAAGAQKMLQHAIIYNSWNDFYSTEGHGLRLAMTRRGGRKRPLEPLKNKLEELANYKEFIEQPIYLIFGPEDHGLNTDDMELCHFMCSLPSYGNFQSYNLAQSALLALYMVQDQLAPTSAIAKPTQKVTRKPVYFPEETLKKWLQASGFELETKKSSVYLTIKKLLLRNTPDDEDLKVLNAILFKNIRQLEKSKDSTFSS